jgi:hypothetical protein
MKWFTTQVDRDFQTGLYGNGIRLYTDENYTYDIITGVSFKEGILIVKNLQGKEITLDNEPDSNMFKQGLHFQWQQWDTKYGAHDSDRTDYEPWAHNSLKSLAMEFGLIPNEGQVYFTSYLQELHKNMD